MVGTRVVPRLDRVGHWVRGIHGRTRTRRRRRWLAEVPTLSGVMCYGADRDEAVARVQALALRVIAVRLEHREAPAEFVNVTSKLRERPAGNKDPTPWVVCNHVLECVSRALAAAR